MRQALFELLAGSWASETAVYLLGNVPGLPPISQAVHILGISVVMGTTVMVNLRMLGLALPSHNLSEMIRRLMPWTWWALSSNLLTGLLFVVARPGRYFFNPVFNIKFALLVPAVILACVVYVLSKRDDGYWDSPRPDGYWECSPGRRIASRIIATTSLVLWVGVILAGRWIAYSDYLFFYE